jgi:hypothetical protein
MKIKSSKINRAAALCAVAFLTLAAPYANAGRFIQPPGPGPTTTGNDGKVSQNRIPPKPPVPPKVANAVPDTTSTAKAKTGTFIGTLIRD